VRVPFLDIKAQYQDLAGELDQTALDVLRSGAYVLGPHNKGLEEEVAQMHGVRHAIAVNSGTDALRILMEAAGVGPGDEVITTAFTFVASLEAIVQIGAVPVLVDILPETFDLDPAAIEPAVTEKTKAILPIHLFGQLTDVRAIETIANRHRLTVLEDAAQAIGSHCEGRYAGQWGRGAGLSFYVTKNLGAIGDGGMILTNDAEVDANSRSLRVHGMGRERYYYDAVGYTSRLSELQAAFLRVKLRKLDEWNAQRDRIAQVYLQQLAGVEGIHLPKLHPGNNHTWHQFTVRTSRRDELQAFLKEREIDSMIYYPVPLHLHQPYARFSGAPGSLGVTEEVSRQVLSLPVHQHLSEAQIEHVVASIRAFAASPAAV